VRVTASPATLSRTYEALRAGALGESTQGIGRGLAILRGAGLAAWMEACPPDRAAPDRERSVRLVAVVSAGDEPGRELVGILADMALGGRTAMVAAR
jgi:hypothetical protein